MDNNLETQVGTKTGCGEGNTTRLQVLWSCIKAPDYCGVMIKFEHPKHIYGIMDDT
jgi:hypothetical protein